MALSFGRDCIFPWRRAQVVDHLVYDRLGRELPLLDVVPLSKTTHDFVTAARDGIGRGSVNLILRLAYGAWLFGDYELCATLAHVAGAKWVPLLTTDDVVAFSSCVYGAVPVVRDVALSIARVFSLH